MGMPRKWLPSSENGTRRLASLVGRYFPSSINTLPALRYVDGPPIIVYLRGGYVDKSGCAAICFQYLGLQAKIKIARPFILRCGLS